MKEFQKVYQIRVTLCDYKIANLVPTFKEGKKLIRINSGLLIWPTVECKFGTNSEGNGKDTQINEKGIKYNTDYQI